jgi:hypothetical protein
VWTVIVEVALVGAEHSTGVPLVVDQHPVGALGTDASNEPLCITVRAGVRGGVLTTSTPWRRTQRRTVR